MTTYNMQAERRALEKFKERLKNFTDDTIENKTKLLAVAECYYKSAEGERPWETINEHFKSLCYIELKNLVLQLCAEGINRDMIKFIQTGTRGTLAKNMYNKLK